MRGQRWQMGKGHVCDSHQQSCSPAAQKVSATLDGGFLLTSARKVAGGGGLGQMDALIFPSLIIRS